jgi:sigma-B regulation protein RsbU (phosphoserine phosphatase)
VPSRSLHYSSAGHPSGYLLDRSGAVKSELDASGLPLGLFPDSVYETRSVGSMEGGDTLLLLTDGVTDCGAPEEDLFGAKRALEVIRSSLGGRSADIGEALYRAVRGFEKGGAQTDDVTTVVVRCLL